MGERQAAEVEVGEDRLDVAVGRAAGRGVAVMADRAVALQRGDDRLLAEDVADQAGGAVIVEMAAVVGDDARGFLAAMLQGMQAERGVGGGIGGPVDAEQRAFLVEFVVVRRALGGQHGGVISGDRRRAIKDMLTAAVWALPAALAIWPGSMLGAVSGFCGRAGVPESRRQIGLDEVRPYP